MNLKKTALLVVLLLAADQALKIWVKTHMQIGDPAIMIFPDWFQLRFIENPGMAFGLRLRMGGAYDWGSVGTSSGQSASARPRPASWSA